MMTYDKIIIPDISYLPTKTRIEEIENTKEFRKAKNVYCIWSFLSKLSISLISAMTGITGLIYVSAAFFNFFLFKSESVNLAILGAALAIMGYLGYVFFDRLEIKSYRKWRLYIQQFEDTLIYDYVKGALHNKKMFYPDEPYTHIIRTFADWQKREEQDSIGKISYKIVTCGDELIFKQLRDGHDWDSIKIPIKYDFKYQNWADGECAPGVLDFQFLRDWAEDAIRRQIKEREAEEYRKKS